MVNLVDLHSHSKASSPNSQLENLFFMDSDTTRICQSWSKPTVEIIGHSQLDRACH